MSIVTQLLQYISRFFEFLDRLSMFWKVAGLAGLALLVMSVVYNRLLRSEMYRSLSASGRTTVIALIVMSVGAVALAAVLVWRPQPFILPSPSASLESPIPAVSEPSGETPSPFPTIVSSCKLELENKGPNGIEMSVAQIQCVDRPETKLQVSYLWLDTATYTELVLGRRSVNFSVLFGDDPLILQNDVFRFFQRFQDHYGVAVDREEILGPNGDDYGLALRRKGKTDWAFLTDLGNSKARAGRRAYAHLPNDPVRILAYEKEFVLPDYDAIDVLLGPTEWPEHYHFDASPACLVTWDPNRDPTENCPLMPIVWRNVKHQELVQHSQRMRAYYRKLFQEPHEYALRDFWRRMKHPYDQYQPPPEIAEDEQTEQNFVTEPQRAADLFAAVAQGDPPDGFVLARGQVSNEPHCDPSERQCDVGWSIDALGPTIRILVMVIEVIGPQGSTFDVASLQENRDGSTELRPSDDSQRETLSESKLPLDVLSDQHKLVIPMRVEFTPYYSFDWGADRAERGAVEKEQMWRQKMVDRWRKLPSGVLGDQAEAIVVGKRVAPILSNVKPFRRRGFIYGPTTRPMSLTLKDRHVLPFRQLDPNYVITEGGLFGKGSCPSVSVKRASYPDWIRLGHVLIGSVDPLHPRTERLSLGKGLTHVTVSEDEAEVSFLSSIKLFGRRQSGQQVLLDEKKFVRLSYGQKVVLKPEKATHHYDDYVLEISGFYQSFRELKLVEANRLAPPNRATESH